MVYVAETSTFQWCDQMFLVFPLMRSHYLKKQWHNYWNIRQGILFHNLQFNPFSFSILNENGFHSNLFTGHLLPQKVGHIFLTMLLYAELLNHYMIIVLSPIETWWNCHIKETLSFPSKGPKIHSDIHLILFMCNFTVGPNHDCLMFSIISGLNRWRLNRMQFSLQHILYFLWKYFREY